MIHLALRGLAAALVLSLYLVTALPTCKSLVARSPEFHGHPDADAAVAPLPHGWYGHDATGTKEHENKIMARDEAKKHAAKLDVKREESEKAKRTNSVYDYDSDGYIINVRRSENGDYADGFEYPDKVGKKSKRFADAGADPAASWFPQKLERRIADAMPKALRKVLGPREPVSIACARHNVKCRSMEEKRAFADALSGASLKKM